jgi:hypothetical protein
MSHEEALKLDILLRLQKDGWNLKETDDPATLSMNIGTGYTLFASVNKPWYILFDDGVEKTEYPIDSERVPFTNRKDVNKLWGKFEAGVKALGISGSPKDPLSPPAKREETPKRKKPASAKKKARVEAPGMMLPIVYPAELKGSFMLFKQWTAQNNVIPADSEVVILEETEKSFRVSIARAHISFNISKTNAEVVES